MTALFRLSVYVHLQKCTVVMSEKVKIKWSLKKKNQTNKRKKNSAVKTSQEIYFGTFGCKKLIFEQA